MKSSAATLLGFHGGAGELDRRLREILNEHMDTGRRITGTAGEMLIQLSPHACSPDEEKRPISVKSEKNSSGRGAHAVYTLADGTVEILSISKARRRIDNGAKSYQSQRLLGALRYEIVEQINEMRRKLASRMLRGEVVKCPLSNQQISNIADVDVHHDEIDFVTLAAKWARREGLRGRNILTCSKTNGEGAMLASESQRQSWRQYHKQHAVLKCVLRKFHRKLSKGKFELDW